MKKIPTLFERVFEGHEIIVIKENITVGMEWVAKGEGIATVKIDGSCCAIINGSFYKRYDAKAGKIPPLGAIPCCEPDIITGHWPHWVKVEDSNKADIWFMEAYKNSEGESLEDGTYEAIGPHFQGNPYGLEKDILVRHGIEEIKNCPRTMEGIREYLACHNIEGIVFWKDGEPQCKIKRRDFGFKWPISSGNLGKAYYTEIRFSETDSS